jgi:glutathione peroxidase
VLRVIISRPSRLERFMTGALYQIPIVRIDGKQTTLAEYHGSVLLIVNVASACGLTRQYAGLESLYENYNARGFVVLGFPCNDFGGQEPGSPAEIQQFCATKFGVQFPLFEKIAVNSLGRHALYRHLIEAQPLAQVRPDSHLRRQLECYGFGPENHSDVLWNFEKFLVDRRGRAVGRFAPDMPPDDPAILGAIEARLAQS